MVRDFQLLRVRYYSYTVDCNYGGVQHFPLLVRDGD